MKIIREASLAKKSIGAAVLIVLILVNAYILSLLLPAFKEHPTVNAQEIAVPPVQAKQISGNASATPVALSDARAEEKKPRTEPLLGPPVPKTYPPPTKQAALTFDDGPDSKYTPQILDLLRDWDVKATFFVVGKQVNSHPQVLKRIAKEGHAIGNHSWDHADLTKVTPQHMKQEIESTDDAIAKLTGIAPTLFRAPYGATNEALKHTIKSADRHLIDWNVDTRDWAGTSPEDILEIVKKTVKPGSIILMHSFGGRDGNLSNTVEALPLVIDYLRENGYALVTVSDLNRK
ncbi:polysaccharide deacetylase family protein [Paenibacillus cremeus]|uniref:polysaccharide deacetylase family protein n=1 Tax=Paenibacillus cremeus TaxID=2163881 RepID=UPI0021BD5400|nr:polysaccharide deacetylase family protein [Paenibacillus cremeus]